MSQGRKEPRRKGRRPEAGPAGPSPEPGRGGLASRMRWAVVSANVVAVLAMGLAVAGLALHFTEENGGGSTTAKATPTPTPAVVQVSVDDSPSWGPQDAPVTIVEFSDYL
jgi:protein-disulfide isomerase